MKQFKAFLLLALLCLAGTLRAQQMPPLPVDPAVRVGKLPNGMTYYIRHNALPEKQAFFYIAQKVGSVQEEESQRGLAHFLEHMAFNGSQNFPNSGDLVGYCERIGVKSGENLNAGTGMDMTVYNIDNVPVTESNIDSCLLILHDWSGFLTLDAAEIDKERGVIHEEWRLRSSAMQRIMNRNLEKLYPGSRYGKRMPIGLMEIIDNFPPDTLRAYYHKWYHPSLQGLVIVGDFDVDVMEQKVKALFSDIPNPENEAPYVLYDVPDTPQPIYVIDKDKEQNLSLMMVCYKTDVLPAEMRGTLAFLMQNYMAALMCNALNARLNEKAQQPDCPFVAAEVGYGNYLYAKTKDALELDILPKPGQDAAALQSAIEEVRRAAEFGFTDTEILRVDDEYLSAKERTYDNREKQRSSFFVPQYVNHFLEGDAIPSIQDEYETLKMLSTQLRGAKQLAPMVSMGLAQLASKTDTNFVVLALYPEKEGVTLPTEEQLSAAVAAANAAQLEAYVDNVKNEPLVPQLPQKGSIKKEETADFGYTKWTLSNGAVVYWKTTDFNESQVLMTANSWGGYTKLDMKDHKTFVNARLADEVRNATGLGNFKATELEKALAGKQASVRASLSNSRETLKGQATPKDMRTLFELTYLQFTAPGNDSEAFQNYVSMNRSQLENAEKVPEMALQDSLYSTLYDNHPGVRRVTAADLDAADYELAKQIAAERFNSPSDFTFYFTGNINADSLRLFTEQYIASIPAAKKKEKATDPHVDLAAKSRDNRFVREMETPKSTIVQAWHGKHPYSLKEAEVVNALGEILSQRLLKTIREDAGIAYSCGALAKASKDFSQEWVLQVFCPVQPASVDSALLLIRQGIEGIARDGVTEEELNKVKEFELKEYADNQKLNSYWQELIATRTEWGTDERTGREEAIRSVTPADVQAFCRDILLKKGTRLTVTMLPASLEEKD